MIISVLMPRICKIESHKQKNTVKEKGGNYADYTISLMKWMIFTSTPQFVVKFMVH